jgi:chorismate mutase
MSDRDFEKINAVQKYFGDTSLFEKQRFDVTSKENKEKLLDMARNGEPRPIVIKHPLGVVLCHYTNVNSVCYDHVFDKEIRELRPDWFISQSDKAQEKKNKLLEMAKNGEDKPHYKTSLGQAFCNYTNKSHDCYDHVFDKEIRELRLDWLITKFNIAQEKKNKLLEMAKNGEPRPNNKKHSLGGVLSFYTNAKSESYDPVFDKEIRELRPDWFVTQSDKAQEKKNKLLEMAKNGEDKPHRKTGIGQALISYTDKCHGSYDPVFDKKIRELRPD